MDRQDATSVEMLLKLPASVQYIVHALQAVQDAQPAQIIRILKEAKVSTSDLTPWADFDHPVTDSYGRKMIFKGEHFEIMAMSWRPGDFSAIHDHGYTQWGAVQIFGAAEHATFRVEDGSISTLARWIVNPGDIIGVGHSLVHQMGNSSADSYFLSLHVYGKVQHAAHITGDARVFDLEHNTIQRVDGGVFFALPPEAIKRIEPGPTPDFPTRLRHMIELIRRLQKMKAAGINPKRYDLSAIIAATFSSEHRLKLLRCLSRNTNEKDHQQNSIYWRALNWELKEAAKLQEELQPSQGKSDRFHKYAELYDGLIGQPCLDAFMRKYLHFVQDKYDLGFRTKRLLSLGCGTGLIESCIIDELGMPFENLLGIDISVAMISEAKKRIQAEVGDVLDLDPQQQPWDLAYMGLNVFHYLDHTRLEEAIQKTAAVLQEGGYFIGDFITPDHIRWYPNVAYSADRKMISLRTPELVEEGGSLFQESEIINIRFQKEVMEVSYAGKHRRFLPALHRIRQYFEMAFGGQVDLYDAHSLEVIPEQADSCASTRFLVVAQKKRLADS